ncbi:hypothetical protein MRX96_052614 [Rhipicephalus microplus]
MRRLVVYPLPKNMGPGESEGRPAARARGAAAATSERRGRRLRGRGQSQEQGRLRGGGGRRNDGQDRHVMQRAYAEREPGRGDGDSLGGALPGRADNTQ